jgi:energy-coupling factor transporter ATP-binding protein EcfA2
LARDPVAGAAGGETLLELVDADLAPPGRAEPLLRGVSFRLRRGETAVLLGANGSGKTTLLRSAAGLWPLVSGSLRPPAESGFDVRRAGLLLEDPSAQFTAGTVSAEIEFGLEGLGLGPEEIAARCAAVLEALGIQGWASIDPRTLSPGEQERALLAVALAPGPPLLLLDDPFLYLGPGEARRAWSTVVEFVRGGTIGAVLLATHDPEPSRAADFLGVLSAGRLLVWGAPAEVWSRDLPPEVERPDRPVPPGRAGEAAHAS